MMNKLHNESRYQPLHTNAYTRQGRTILFA
jgi:hypothetical protein